MTIIMIIMVVTRAVFPYTRARRNRICNIRSYTQCVYLGATHIVEESEFKYENYKKSKKKKVLQISNDILRTVCQVQGDIRTTPTTVEAGKRDFYCENDQ